MQFEREVEMPISDGQTFLEAYARALDENAQYEPDRFVVGDRVLGKARGMKDGNLNYLVDDAHLGFSLVGQPLELTTIPSYRRRLILVLQARD